MFSAAAVCLFVCQFVCQHNNFRTIKHDETWRLGALYKNLARVRVSRSKVKGQGNRGQKKRKSAAFCSGVILWVRSSCGIGSGPVLGGLACGVRLVKHLYPPA